MDMIQDYKGPPVLIETQPIYPNSRSNSTLPFQLPRLPFFSRTRTSDTPPFDDVDSNFQKSTSASETTLTSNLQVSVMISMPSSHSRTYYPSDGGNIGAGITSEKAPAHSEDFEFEGVPDVAFGVAVVPLRPDELHSAEKEK